MTVDTTELVKMIRSGDKTGMLAYLKKGGDPNARNQMCWTLLHLACFEGQREIAEILLDGGASVNSCTTDMSTPLHRACAQGNKPCVEMLVKKGAYLNAQDKNGNTPLHEAARGFHTSVVKILLDKKADRTKVNRKKQTFLNLIGQQLMPSVESGDCEALQQWLEWGASPDTKGNLHWSILHHACARGQLNIASLLIERGADVNIEDSNKTTPLHTACFNGHFRIASLLSDSKANLDAQDQRGNTPLHSAISGGHPNVVNLLLERGCDTTIPNKEGQYFTHLVNEFLVTSVHDSKVAQVISLLKGRADPNTRDPYGYTVLCQAAFKGDVLVADALLEGGADPNLTDEIQGKTPLHYASAWGHLFVVKALLDKGASVHIKDKVGATPLHEAAREGSEDVIVVLIGRGANFNEPDQDGNTPLHIAGKWGQSDAVELLIEKKAKETLRNKSNLLYSDLALIRAVRTEDKTQVVSGLAWGGDPNSRDHREWTLLHHAVYKGVQDICEVLLENGANVNAVDSHDRTPLLLAAYRGNHQIMKVLLDAGADINAQDWKGRTPLHWAANEGSIETVQMLLDHKANKNLKNKDGLLYSNLLLKHLYFAVRHNDADKVVRLVAAGADQFAEVEGTGVSSRDEALRRGFYDILRQMAAMVEKKPRPEDDKIIALEDVHRLFDDAIITEDGDFATPDEGQEECEEQEVADAAEERDESVEDDYEEEGAYWKMSKAYEVLTVEEAFGVEDYAWLKEFEEKPKVISAKELLEEEQAAFWETWQEKQKVISAKEFFKEKTDWWEDDDEDEDHENEDKNEDDDDDDDDDNENMSNSELGRDDECWWRDAQEDTDKPKPISAKEYFKEERPWWESKSDDKDGNEKDSSPKEYFTHDIPWWQTEEHKANVISSKELFKDDEKPWWEDEDKQKALSAKEYFQDEKPWWQTDEEQKAISAKEYFKEEVPWWQEDKPKAMSAKEFFKDEELPWWYTEEMHPDKSDVLKKSLATARFFERYPPNKRICGEEEVVELPQGNVLSDDEIEESTRTDDFEDATDSLISDSSTMYSASEGERPQASALSKDIPWWEDGSKPLRKQNIPKADEYFQEKHWLDDASETSEPTETLDMDTSDISELVTGNDLSKSVLWHHPSDSENIKHSEGSDESAMDEEEDDLEEEEESGELEVEEDVDDEMGEEACVSECEELQSEDEIEDIMDEELVEEVNTCFENTKDVCNKSNDGVMVGQKNSEVILGESNYHEPQKDINIPSIVLHKIGNENGNNKYRTRNVTESRDSKLYEDSSSVDLISKVVSKSNDTLDKESTNLDIGFTNTDSPIESSQYSISVHDIAGNLQKSDSQTSGYDSSLSLSDSKARDLSKDSGCEGLSVDECVEDTDNSDITFPVGTEAREGLDDPGSPIHDECENVNNSVIDIELLAKELGEVSEHTLCQDTDRYPTIDSNEITMDKQSQERECSTKIVIQMKWDTTEDRNSSPPNEQRVADRTLPINSGNKNVPTEGGKEKKNDSSSESSLQQSVNDDQAEIKTYAAAVKSNLEKTVNKMGDCLARLDASLAWLDATITKESEERASNENLRDKNLGERVLTYAGAVNRAAGSPIPDKKRKGLGSNGERVPDSEVRKKEEKDMVHFMKINVRVPEEESSKDQEIMTSESKAGYGMGRFARESCPKRDGNRDLDTNINFKASSQSNTSGLNDSSTDNSFSAEATDNMQKESSIYLEACVCTDLQLKDDKSVSNNNENHEIYILHKDEATIDMEGSNENIDFSQEKETTKSSTNSDRLLSEAKITNDIKQIEESTVLELNEDNQIDSSEIQSQNSNSNPLNDNTLVIDDQENLTVDDKTTRIDVKEEDAFKTNIKHSKVILEDPPIKTKKQVTIQIADEAITAENESAPNLSEETIKKKKENTETKELSRESSTERLSPHRDTEPASLHTDRSLWRCSTYDALSISDYDNIAFMIQKSSSTPACWGSRPKRKECSISTDTTDQAADVLTRESSIKSNGDQQESASPDATKVRERKPSLKKTPTRRLPPEGAEFVHSNKTSTDDSHKAKEPLPSDKTLKRNLPHSNVPEALSVPLPEEEPTVLAAEACTNLRDTSCNQDPPVAPRRTKEYSLQSQKVKYKVADHSAHTQPSNALKQPTNTTLYDPDKKETSKVEAAVNVRLDEPRVQQVSTNRSKEGKKDKEKQKELAVATGKIDPVRKSSSCSVS